MCFEIAPDGQCAAWEARYATRLHRFECLPFWAGAVVVVGNDTRSPVLPTCTPPGVHAQERSHQVLRANRHRPRKAVEAYLRLRTLPGEQCQCDWASFSHLMVGRARRPLMAFVILAFQAFGGCSRVVEYDNLKSAVLERYGQAIHFNPPLLSLAGHYRDEPRPVALARGNEKGRVERAIRYIRSAFFAAREFRDLADLNAQADTWCAGQSMERPCPQDRSMTVREAFLLEQPYLLALQASDVDVDVPF